MREAIAYLCGPINGASDEECNHWRDMVTELWGGPVLNPMRRDYRGKEAVAYREIVELDKIDVAASDVLIVTYDKPSVGTSMEILYAWQMGKPIVVVCKSATVISPWLRYHCHHMTNSYLDAVAAARRLAGGV